MGKLASSQSFARLRMYSEMTSFVHVWSRPPVALGEMSNVPAELIAALADSQHIVALTGAGVSAASGIPTFRDALTGLWAKYDPTELATPEAFSRNPKLVAQWYDQRRVDVLACEPNGAHVALAELEARCTAIGKAFTLITQNVDRLHQRAGSREVVELHGSLFTWRCTKTGAEIELLQPEPIGEYPPRSAAGAPMRPGVVWFGEMLPTGAIAAAETAARACDLFLSLGTSSVVYPAAGLVELAAAGGAKTCEINLEPTPISDRVDWSLLGPCDALLPDLLRSLDTSCST